MRQRGGSVTLRHSAHVVIRQAQARAVSKVGFLAEVEIGRDVVAALKNRVTP
jgi:hypothetical protein